jgi:hypothetical protein
MKFTLSMILLIIAVVCFAVGFIRPGLGGFHYTAGGLAFAAASLVV